MTISTAYAALAVADLTQADAFYSRLFDRPADLEPMPSLKQWDLGSGGVQVVEDAASSGQSMCTLFADDLEATVAELASRGFETGDIGGTVARIIQLTDPADNTITIAEAGSAS